VHLKTSILLTDFCHTVWCMLAFFNTSTQQQLAFNFQIAAYLSYMKCYSHFNIVNDQVA